ncbi:hypothetical protein F5883DRAFT_514464 [Diaporthe sp. PMI_573]|nr:hypothetical protein F5883DRAFT_514464 [Diaporthaceae sp. PMI_573]
MVVCLLLVGDPGLLPHTFRGTSLPTLVGCAGAVPRSSRRCTETRLKLSQGWDRSLASLSAFSNFPIPPPAPTPRVFIAAQPLSNHLPRSFYTDQGVLSLNLFRLCPPSKTVYTQGTQVPSTLGQSSPAVSRQRRPPIGTSDYCGSRINSSHPSLASRLESPLQPESSTRPGGRQVHNNSSNPTTIVTLSIRTEAEPTIRRTRC